jgi:hypothetical protein
MPDPTSSDALRDALAGLPPIAYAAAAERQGPLQQKVCAVVDDMKAAGMKPEHVILAVKGIAFDAQMGPGSQRLIDAIVRWCLEQYFKA